MTNFFQIRAKNAPIEPQKYMGCGRCDAITKTAPLPALTRETEKIAIVAKRMWQQIRPVVSDVRGVNLSPTLFVLMLSTEG